MGLHRPAVIFSIVLHVTGFFIVVGVPRLLASGPEGGKVYFVDLVSLPGPAGPGPAAPAPRGGAAAAPKPEAAKPPAPRTPPAKKPAEKKPTEKAIVLPERDARKKPAEKKPVARKEEPPAKADETPARAPEPTESTSPAAGESSGEPAPAAGTLSGPGPASPVPGGVPDGTGAAVGGGGEGTGGGGDAYTFYLSLLKRNIENAWKRPVYTGDKTLSATVQLTLTRSGRVQRLEMKQPSGFEPLDRSLMQAVRAAEPFPPFPLTLAMDSLAVQIVFDLTPEGADTGEPGD